MSSRSDAPRSTRFSAGELWLAVPALCFGAIVAFSPSKRIAHSPAAHASPAHAPNNAALRVCADPNNLPFSNRAGEGFENHIAALVARDLHRKLEYYWWPQRRGFVRNTLAAGKCDLIAGVPLHYPPVLTTAPYYRSSYVFVSRASGRESIRSLDDPRLRQLRIGLHFTGGHDNPPAEHSLARRHIISNIVAYSIYGNYGEPNPPRGLIDAVARGDIDVAIAWGPLAGYFAAREPKRLVVHPVFPVFDGPGETFQFDIAMGVAKGDTALEQAVDGVLERERANINRILRAYGVPLASPDRTDPGHRVVQTAATVQSTRGEGGE